MNSTYIAYDLETTGLRAPIQIISIGWCVVGNDGKLAQAERLAFPTRSIESGAQRVHGWTADMLFETDAMGERDAVEVFFDALRVLNAPVILAAHNGDRYDRPILERVMREHGMSYPENVTGHLDTRTIFKGTLDKFAQLHNVHEDRAIHGALVDARLLARVIEKALREGAEPQCTLLL